MDIKIINKYVKKYKEAIEKHSTSELRIISEILLDSGPSNKIDMVGCRFVARLLFTMMYLNCMSPSLGSSFIEIYKELFYDKSLMSDIINIGMNRRFAESIDTNILKESNITLVQILTYSEDAGNIYTPTHTFLICKNNKNRYTVLSSWNPPKIHLIQTNNLTFIYLHNFLSDICNNVDIQKKLFGIKDNYIIRGDIKVVCFSDDYINKNYPHIYTDDICDNDNHKTMNNNKNENKSRTKYRSRSRNNSINRNRSRNDSINRTRYRSRSRNNSIISRRHKSKNKNITRKK